MMKLSRPSLLLGAAVVFFAAVVALAFVKENGLRDVANLQSEIAFVDAQAAGLKHENAMMARELASLNSSSAYAEAIARDSLGLVKPGEVVYEFIPAGQIARPAGVE